MGDAMGFEISTVRHFSASHQLQLYDGSLEPLHGHNWAVKVTVSAPKLDAIGVVMDFHALERLVDGVVGTMHNRHLNDLEPFSRVNPSAEGVAMQVAAGLHLGADITLKSVEVWETADNSATYRP
jgi:6-pyruvoyltetrahydropterin/6-carboxytetrahydropterin synthase